MTTHPLWARFLDSLLERVDPADLTFGTIHAAWGRWLTGGWLEGWETEAVRAVAQQRAMRN